MGYIPGVYVLSNPWPPATPVQFFAHQAADSIVVSLTATTEGCLLVQFERPGDVPIAHTFGPLHIPGAARVVLGLNWESVTAASLTLNGVALAQRPFSGDELGLPAVPTMLPLPQQIFPDLRPSASASEPERLFIQTIADLDAKLLGRVPYEVLRASGLLRQLLLEGLIHLVNRTHGLTFVFTTMDCTAKPPIEPESHWQALDPSLFPGAHTRACDLDEFLGAPMLTWQGHTATVKDVVKACANAKGGVHFGKPRTDDEALVVAWDKVFTVLGGEPSLAALSGIGRITLVGLRELVLAVGTG